MIFLSLIMKFKIRGISKANNYNDIYRENHKTFVTAIHATKYISFY